MDLAKAFDALPHGLMLARSHPYGVTKINSPCNVILDYLSLKILSRLGD